MGIFVTHLVVLHRVRGHLRSLNVICSPQKMATWDIIASANAFLEQVSISLQLDAAGEEMEVEYGLLVEEDYLVGMVRAFYVCTSLRELVGGGFDKLRREHRGRAHREPASIYNACIPLRYRRRIVPSVTLLGVDNPPCVESYFVHAFPALSSRA